jgi:single-strand DNA-binding protein
MSLHMLALGTLTADPQRRTSQKGNAFATGNIRCPTEDDAVFVSVIAFGDQAEQLLAHRQGSTIAVSGRSKLSNWTGRDGVEKRGLSITVEQIASASAARRADADRRNARAADKPLFDGAVR